MATDIVLKDRNGNDVTYSGIETVTFDTPTEGVQATFTLGVEQTGKEVELDLAEGDQVVKADDGYLLKELTIKKPENLLPENIRNGETVGNVPGAFIGDTEEVIVDLSMADGDQVIVPSADGKVLSKVIITKPETLIPENVAKDVEIGGVVGAHEGGAPLCVFSYYTYSSKTISSTTMQWVDNLFSFSIPLSAEMVMFLMGDGKVTGSTTPSNYPKISSMLVLPRSNCTETITENEKTISYTNKQISSSYGVYSACAVILFTIPGITLKTEDDKLIFHCDQSVTTLPNGVSNTARMQNRCEITEIDLGESSITDIPAYMFTSMAATEKVTFPRTLTSIGNHALYYCDALTTVDCTLCTSVPTLGGQYTITANSGLQILVPASLYDEWIAATNWSTYADYIVGV